MRHRYWTSEELESLREMYSTIPNKELACFLQGHTIGSISRKATALGLRKKNPSWNKGLHGDPRSSGLFKIGHPPYIKNAWTDMEIKIMDQNYISESHNVLMRLLPNRTEDAIYAMAHRLEIYKDRNVAIENRAISIRQHYQEHPEDRAKHRATGIQLAQSPYHHRRVPGEYSLPQESRRQISKTLIKTYREHPEIKKVACEALEKARLTMGLGKKPTKPEKQVKALLDLLGAKATPQYRFNGFFLDFALPERKLAILVDGCYWHCCPIHFPMAATRTQQHNLLVDKKREKILRRARWKILHIWEHEVNDPATLENLRKEVTFAHENSID